MGMSVVTPNLYLGFRVNKTKDSVYSRSGNVSGYTKSRVKYTLIESADFIYIIRIKSVSWEYSCNDEYLEEFGKIIKYSLLLAVFPRNRLDPIMVRIILIHNVNLLFNKP